MNDKKGKRKLFHIEFKEPITLRERIYSHLRKAIINNYLPPGQRIFDKEIARSFNVSITPVREALLQLSVEGFVEAKSYKDIIVREISLKEISEIYDVQAVLEGLAGKLAVPNMNGEHLSKMEKLIKKMSEYFSSNKVDKFYEVNQKIHELYIKQSGSQLIYDLVSRLNLRKKMFRYRVTFLSKKEVMKKALEDHKKILKAFLSRDQEKVERLIIEHWRSDTRMKDFETALQNELNRTQGEL
jgi:DNA-binding GntR family transcriptional regulator